ncbi:SDR family NAD(P)-dependent oxidoreductase [Deinococcus deserti]|uniref:Putative oxidoreductase n=1 Tax=Deinococcus deserti (strain DSM 17065 / CIP 109153 / LMG 22923 / VCD115) TaxID=546414 RepID=C1D0D4_DEIDV|nr:SDR family NAD(P)-dependent oxidoreductase [Deinococcus deserti]ACO45308.1 putative oxidoreductase [Deinococcus deserti VCD115]
MTSERPPVLAPHALAGQVIAVTGADQGYGRLVASSLARAGASVVLIGNNSETLAAVASQLELAGGTAVPIKADVAVPLDWLSAQTRILEIFGALAGVVHVADKRSQTNFTSLSENEWMDLFNCNVKSSVAIAQILRRRLPATWLTLIGPHLDERGLQVHPQRGALRGLVTEAHAEELRINLLLPSRACSGDEVLDAPVGQTAVSLALPVMSHLRGNVIDIPLPPAPKIRITDPQLL